MAKTYIQKLLLHKRYIDFLVNKELELVVLDSCRKRKNFVVPRTTLTGTSKKRGRSSDRKPKEGMRDG